MRGYSLIEVMVALLVLAIGVLGLQALLLATLRTSDASAGRTLVSLATQSLADRMAANTPAVWLGSYVGTLTADANATAEQTCARTTPCTPVQLAARDLAAWRRELAADLPDAQALLVCTPARALDATLIARAPPYQGFCDLQVTWTERHDGDDETLLAQQLLWRFVP